MGNPSVPGAAFANRSSTPVPTKHNGILAWVPGQIVSAGSKGLPPAGPGLQPQIVQVDVPDLGAVNVTYEAYQYNHRRSPMWSWRAVWAASELGEQLERLRSSRWRD